MWKTQRRHLGSCHKWCDLTASACWGLTVLMRGVVPVQIWIPGATLKHQLNVTKPQSHRKHPSCNPSVNISAAALKLELVCLPRMSAQSPPTQGAFCPFPIHIGAGSLFTQPPKHTSRALCLTSPITLQSRFSRQIRSYPHKFCCCELMDECEITLTLAIGCFWEINSVVLPYKTWREILMSKHKQMPTESKLGHQ